MKKKFAVLDWGIGGIGIYKEIKARSRAFVLYFSDTGAVAYGKMPRVELAERIEHVIEFLRGKGVTDLVIGCNAASTAIPFIKPGEIRITGVIEKAVEAAAKEKPARLGVIGGRRTILSRVYRNAFEARGIPVKQRIAQPLSGLIESGDLGSEKFCGEAKRILSPLRNCSHILLACTHYPAAAKTLAEFLPNGVTLIDPAKHLADSLDLTNTRTGSDEFYTTGSPGQMARAARSAFGIEIKEIKKIRL
jgi:glutamate racemase